MLNINENGYISVLLPYEATDTPNIIQSLIHVCKKALESQSFSTETANAVCYVLDVTNSMIPTGKEFETLLNGINKPNE